VAVSNGDLNERPILRASQSLRDDRVVTPLTMENLEPLGTVDLSITALPELPFRFKIPKLPEKPHNPIIESLHLWHHKSSIPLPEVKVDSFQERGAYEEYTQEVVRDWTEHDIWQSLPVKNSQLSVSYLHIPVGTFSQTIHGRALLCHGILSESMVYPKPLHFFLKGPATLLQQHDTCRYNPPLHSIH
jgi:hypothetical protein